MKTADFKNSTFKLVAVTALTFFNAQSSFAGFNGFFAGGQVGGGLSNGEHTHVSGGENKNKFRSTGLGFGLQGGYLNYNADTKFLIGGEINALIQTGKGTFDLKNAANTSDGKATASFGYVLGLSALTGVAINPKVAIYTKAGFEKRKLKLNYTDLNPNIQINPNYSKSVTGLAVGGGVMFKINPRLLLAIDYTYTSIPKKSLDDNNVLSVNLSNYTVMLKISYMFGQSNSGKSVDDSPPIGKIIKEKVDQETQAQGGEQAENDLIQKDSTLAKINGFVNQQKNSS